MAEPLNRRAALTKAWYGKCPTGGTPPDIRYESGFTEGFLAAWDALLSEIRPLVSELRLTGEVGHKDGIGTLVIAQMSHAEAIRQLRELVREGE